MRLYSDSTNAGGINPMDSNMVLSQQQTQHTICPSESSNASAIKTMDSNVVLSQMLLNQHSRVSSSESMAILWDIENCPVPKDVNPEDVAGNIRMALKIHPVIKSSITMFSAYGDFNQFPRCLREGCQRTGVKLVDVPNGRKDAADKAILVDMFLFALDNPPPSSILLISGDVDFAPALHILGQRGFTIILVTPSGPFVSSALISAGRYVWDWSCVARGEGFLSPKAVLPRGLSDTCGYQLGYGGYSDTQLEEVIYRGTFQSESAAQTNLSSYWYLNTTDPSRMPQQISDCRTNCLDISPIPVSNTQNLRSSLSNVSDYQYESLDETLFVRPGDIDGLKVQFVKLLELSGGSLPLHRIPVEYQRIFRKPLFVAEYGVPKLMNLLSIMGDTIALGGKGNKKVAYLRQSIDKPDKVVSTSPSGQGRKDKKGKGIQAECRDLGPHYVFSLSDFSDDDRTAGAALNSTCELYYRLEEFKQEVQELFVSCSHRIPVDKFDELYKLRYKKTVNCRSFGVQEFEELVDKVKDVMLLYEQPDSKRKYLVPNYVSS